MERTDSKWVQCLRIDREAAISRTMKEPLPANIPGELLNLLGAVAGGAAGYFAFVWIARQGLYALVIPGAALGFGASLGARHRSQFRAVACAGAALVLALFCEWRIAPFIADDSLRYFLIHLHELRPITLVFSALGSFLAYRLALGFGPRPQASPSDLKEPPAGSGS